MYKMIINIMKKLYIILFIVLFLVTNAQAENIKKIYVSGNVRISTETIILFGSVNIGDNLEAKDLNKYRLVVINSI